MTKSLVEQLTWAAVELTNPYSKSDLKKIATILESALGLAIVADDVQMRLSIALAKQAQVLGQ